MPAHETLIIGSLGSMGTRYRAIMRYLDVNFASADVHNTEEQILADAKLADQIVVCTPTENHFQWLKKIIPMGKPILCEKPITKNLKELEVILSLANKFKTPFNMTFQYSELVSPFLNGDSYYNYFRSGKDGLIWDCLQIIALAKGEAEISNSSPLWKCMINGQKLNLGDMDAAYLNFFRKWLSGSINQSPDMLMGIHEKTERLNNDRKFV